MPYLVDGNNLIGHSREQRMKDPGDRSRLVRKLAEFCRQKRTEVTVVFDGDPDKRLPKRRMSLGCLSVVFAGTRRDADSVLLEMVVSAQDPAGLVVVTSDRSLSDKLRHAGARTQRSHVFRRALRRLEIADSDDPERGDGGLTPSEIEDWMNYFSGEGSDID